MAEEAKIHSQPTLGSLQKSVRVAADPHRAFEVFTARMAKWWPATHSIGKSPLSSVVLEPRVGGLWYEIDEDGNKCLWGDVLEWSPPHKLVLAWRIRENWIYDPDLLTEVVVRFDPISDRETLVVVQHQLIENLEGGSAEAFANLDSKNGWNLLLVLFSKQCQLSP